MLRCDRGGLLTISLWIGRGRWSLVATAGELWDLDQETLASDITCHFLAV